MNKLIGHTKTVLKHKFEVARLCFKAGIFFQGCMHDMSKFSPSEFIAGIKFYSGKMSPNVGEREKFGYSKAWLHHKGRNKHHFEYWYDYSTVEKKNMPVKMPLKYLKEMFCDRVGASMVYCGKNYSTAYPLEYFRKGHAGDYMHPETAKMLEKLLIMLRDEGEERVFEYIRELKEY